VIKGKRNVQFDTMTTLEASLCLNNGHARCIVVNEDTATWGYRNIATDIIPKDSIPVFEDGELTHFLNYYDKKLTPIVYTSTDNANKTPEDCYEAQFWEELEKVLSLRNNLMEKIKLGIFVALAICEVIVMFLFGVILMGGG